MSSWIRQSIHHHVLYWSIGLYLVLFAWVQWLQPAWLYLPDGSLRSFGIGYQNKTIFPIWLFALILGILCYLGLLVMDRMSVFN